MKIPVVINIPHACWEIPDKEFGQFVVPEWQLIYEHLLQVDWFLDELFAIPGATCIRAPFSRLLVDAAVTLTDAANASGAICTHGSRGQRLRGDLHSFENRRLVDEYFIPHQEKLRRAIQSALEAHGSCFLIDCRSSTAEIFESQNSDAKPADIIIGITKGNSPKDNLRIVVEFLSARGFSVDVEDTFKGCSLPKEYVGNSSVSALTIEMSRRLYMTQKIPPFSPEAFSKEYLPHRSGSFWEIKRVIREMVYDAVGIRYSGPPDDQLNLRRFMDESANGEISAEMSAWWKSRY